MQKNSTQQKRKHELWCGICIYIFIQKLIQSYFTQAI